MKVNTTIIGKEKKEKEETTGETPSENEKKEILSNELKHIDIEKFNAVPLIEEFENTAFQARNLATAAKIYEKMLVDKDCSIILCLAGSLFSAGLKKVVYDLVKFNMVDAIVSTGAIIVDQDFFEALGFKHYIGTDLSDDEMLRKHSIDRIYDTYIDEEELRICDETIAKIADELKPKPYSSREFIIEIGKFLDKFKQQYPAAKNSVVSECYKKGVPIFVPAFSDCSAGFGLIEHQFKRKNNEKVSIDSAKDFLELTKIKLDAKETGLVMIGGGVPKNFAQDMTVAAEILSKFVHKEAKMHKYAIQITVADERDGGLSGSTLKEAHSWGKVDNKWTQMVYSEATIAFPLLASYVYHKGAWKNRKPKNYNKFLEEVEF
ncbi:MAG: deoxyhypusine synthase [Candidatus Altiarchaeales archaeon HGW-Altiarchaeales-1]|nr:MAG: deoxyhypusine synthase [Candidatus Altiarchaeales archaeon HGW-Altiarchaeales-1]